MKRHSMVVMLMALTAFSFSFAQTGNFSAGIVASHFINQSGDQRLSDAKHPLGSGLLVGYQVNENLAIGLTGEYFSNNLEQKTGTEKMYRGHLSLIVYPYAFSRLNVYFSGGIVYAHQKTIVDNSEGTNDKVLGRLGLGLDYRLINSLSINADVGFYNNGYNINGWSNSFGLRYVLPRF